MKLPILTGGYIYPTALIVVEGGEYLEVTSEQHEIILEGFNGELEGEDVKFTAYRTDGSSEDLTPELRKKISAALADHPGMVEVGKRVKDFADSENKTRKEAIASIGKKREKEDA